MEVSLPYHSQTYWETSSSDYQAVISDDDQVEITHVTSKVFERSRIKALADEREIVQKKTFTKWINSSLFQRGLHVDDLYIDLRDGKVLLALVEVLSNEIVPKPTRGRMRIHCLENVDKCLGFLYDKKVHLENVGAHDIVDGNSRLTLGLIWTMILRFQIQDIYMDELDSTDAKCAKDALLLWCQMKTAGYPSVNIRNFTTSWRNGLGFVALIHKHRPDIISFSDCNRGDNIANLTLAFNVAEKCLGLAALLDPEDVDVNQPEERSIITYLASYYHYFNALKANIVLNKRLNKLLNQAIEDKQMSDLYQSLVTKLLEWIEHTKKLLNMRQFANSISGVQHQMNTFNLYRIKEKPPKFVEKGDLEVLLFKIKSSMISSRRKVYNPPEDFSLATINKAWDELNKSEHDREMALRKELIRQEYLKNLAQKFLRKAALRESWISDNMELLSKQSLGNNLPTVMAALKKHEAIETDIYAYEENLICLTKLSENLDEEMYNDISSILSEKDKVLELWKNLLRTIHERREYLDNHLQVYNLLNGFIEIEQVISDLSSRLKSGEYGKHLLGVEELLRCHELIEANLKVLNQRLEKIVSETDRYIKYADKDFNYNSSNNKETIVEKRYATIEMYHDLLDLAEERRQGLQHSHRVWQYVIDISCEEQWIKEMLEIMNNPDIGVDLSSVDRCLRKHKAMEEDLSKRRQLLESKLVEGKQLAEDSQVGEEIILRENEKIQKLWEMLIDATESRKQRLMEMFDFYQFTSDCDDLNCWINEFRRFFDLSLLGDKMSHTEMLIRNNQQNMQIVEEQREHLNQLGFQSQALLECTNIDKDAIKKKMKDLEDNYKSLLELAHKLQEKLLDSLTVYRLLNDADSVRSWITEKEKFLVNFIPSDDIEELEMLMQRFGLFENDLTKEAEKVFHVNTLSENLVINGNPNYKMIIDNQDNLNNVWNKMADLVDSKREDLLAKYHYNHFNVDCQQTIEWIKEKIQLVESTDEIKDDIDGLLQIQRRISHLQRDICAIEAKIDHLDSQGALIIRSKLRDQKEIEDQLDLVHFNWDFLNKMLRDRDSRLAGKNDFHRFLCNLDQIQLWLSQMQTEMATQTIPESLTEIETMINEYNGLRDEISKMEPQVRETMQLGRDLTTNCDTNSDQKSRLLQRLTDLENGWQTLMDLSDEKEKRLEQYLKSMMFFEDAKHIEKILSNQETFLTKEIQSNMFDTRGSKSNLLALHEIVNDTDLFIQKMESDSKMLYDVIDQGKILISENNCYKDKIDNKCKLLEERWKKNLLAAKERRVNLKEQLSLHELLQDIDDFDDNLIEKIHTLGEIVTCNSDTIKNSLSQIKALEDELSVYRPRVEELNKSGHDFAERYPKYKSEIDSHLDNLNATLSELIKAFEDKSSKLTDINREAVFVESTKSMMNWLESLENQVIVDEDPDNKLIGLTSINDELKKLSSKNEELENKRQIMENLKSHSDKLKEQFPDRVSHYEEIEQRVKVTMTSLSAPLNDKLSLINQKKEGEEFLRNCEEEIDWINEKIKLIKTRKQRMESTCSLQECQQLGSRNKSVKKEVENRRPRIQSLIEEGQTMVYESHPNKEHIAKSVSHLQETWEKLYAEIKDFELILGNQMMIQEYLFDVSEACSWMSEKELDLVNIRISKKDDQQLRRLTRKHRTLEIEIRDYLANIQDLGKRCQALPSDYMSVQHDLIKNHDVLNSICWEKKTEISLFLHYCDTFDLFQNIEVWIMEKTKIARNDDAGRDLDQCSLLRDRFAVFASETNRIGTLKIRDANKQFDELIIGKHPFAHSVSMWKDRINEIWADLLELIDTRIQLLKSAWDLHRWYCDCQFLLEGIAEKKVSILTLNELGKDPKSVGILQRKLKIFEKDLSRIDSEINASLAVSDHLLPLYSKDKEAMLLIKRNELIQAFQSLRKVLEDRKVNNVELADYHNFMAMIRQLLSWIGEMSTQMEMKHKPRDVSGIELLLANHRNLKTEMDSKEENFSICLNLGGTLVRTKHVKSTEIRSKCNEICEKREELFNKWFGILDHLFLLVEVYQWARDAATAESWLIAQETYLLNEDLGQSLDETMAILKKFLLFEKTYMSQTEKFEQIKKLTTLELRAKQINAPKKPLKKAEVKSEHLVVDEIFDLPSEKSEAVKMSECPNTTFVPEKTQSFVRRCNSIDSCLDQESERKTPFSLQQTTIRPMQSRPLSQQPPSSPIPSKNLNLSRPLPSNLSKSQNVISSSTDTVITAPKSPNSSKPEDIVFKGPLYRKHQWAIQGMKAANRTWHSMYIQVASSRMTFFKDERHYRENPAQYYKHEMPLVLRDIVAAPAQDYIKRPCVFRVRHRNGAEYLFQASSVVDMTRWVDNINAATTRSNRSSNKGNTLSTTQSHPDLSSSSRREQTPQPEKGLKRFFSSIRLKK